MKKNVPAREESLFTNKLAAYSAFVGAALLLTPNSAKADIVHVDPADITVKNNGEVSLDLDDNGIFDFAFEHVGSQNATSSASSGFITYSYKDYIRMEPASSTSSSQGGSMVFDANYVQRLNSNISLVSSLSWDDNTKTMARYSRIRKYNTTAGSTSTYYSADSKWSGSEEKFIGVKFKIGNDYHYGWIRASVSGTTNLTLTIHDWAYEDEAGTTLKTGEGDTPTPIELASFNVSDENGTVRLNWQTASETENNGFVIQRKTDAGAWEKVADYQSDASLLGQGTTSETNNYSWLDESILPGKSYKYQLGDVDHAGNIVWHDAVEITLSGGFENIPGKFGLESAFPNPFNPTLTIKYDLSEDAQTSVRILDLNGKPVATLENGSQKAGNHEVKWDAADHASGIYLVEVVSGEKRDLKKVLLTK